MNTKAGDDIKTENAGWTFGGDTVKNFQEHVGKSVPLYNEGHQLICQLSDFFIKSDSVCYDIGTSLGMLLYLLQRHNSRKTNVQWIGIDCEEDMIKKAQAKNTANNIIFQTENIISYDLESSDFITAYYTLQFIEAKHRQDVITKIYEALNWGGGFVLFEKVRAPDARFQDMITTLYMNFKLRQGYAPDEILNKLNSLKGVLDPFTRQANISLLKRAGFVDITTIQKSLCFEGFLAIK
jgi:tRNA (cmo5U34)-methyltransferase